ncbi:MAG: sugar transporter [Moraxella sp.]|nr:sugar transporter [Moraxella sp.]
MQQTSRVPVIVLAMAAFIFNTTEFIPIALLTDIGASFGMSAKETGLMMTVYAWIVAVLSLPIMLLTAKVERKKLLLGLFLVFVGSHLVSFLASSFGMLLVSRAGVAVAHACFWSITASLAIRLAPEGYQTRALGLLATGGALAMILGLPLGRLLGQAFDWRLSFGVIGLFGVGIMGLLAWCLPRLPVQNVGSFDSLPAIIKNKPLIAVYAMILLMVTAHFTAYSYIEPFVLTVTDFGANVATAVLLLFGVAGIFASVLFGRFYDKRGDQFLMTAFFGMLSGLFLLLPLSGGLVPWAVLLCVWGVSMTALALALQMRALKSAPDATDVAMSIFSGIFNVGIGAGAMVGGLAIAYVGLPWVGVVAGLILGLAVLVFWGFGRTKE